jgi:hypothetical protein
MAIVTRTHFPLFDAMETHSDSYLVSELEKLGTVLPTSMAQLEVQFFSDGTYLSLAFLT